MKNEIFGRMVLFLGVAFLLSSAMYSAEHVFKEYDVVSGKELEKVVLDFNPDELSPAQVRKELAGKLGIDYSKIDIFVSDKPVSLYFLGAKINNNSGKTYREAVNNVLSPDYGTGRTSQAASHDDYYEKSLDNGIYTVVSDLQVLNSEKRRINKILFQARQAHNKIKDLLTEPKLSKERHDELSNQLNSKIDEIKAHEMVLEELNKEITLTKAKTKKASSSSENVSVG